MSTTGFWSEYTKPGPLSLGPWYWASPASQVRLLGLLLVGRVAPALRPLAARSWSAGLWEGCQAARPETGDPMTTKSEKLASSDSDQVLAPCVRAGMLAARRAAGGAAWFPAAEQSPGRTETSPSLLTTGQDRMVRLLQLLKRNRKHRKKVFRLVWPMPPFYKLFSVQTVLFWITSSDTTKLAC